MTPSVKAALADAKGRRLLRRVLPSPVLLVGSVVLVSSSKVKLLFQCSALVALVLEIIMLSAAPLWTSLAVGQGCGCSSPS